MQRKARVAGRSDEGVKERKHDGRLCSVARGDGCIETEELMEIQRRKERCRYRDGRSENVIKWWKPCNSRQGIGMIDRNSVQMAMRKRRTLVTDRRY